MPSHPRTSTPAPASPNSIAPPTGPHRVVIVGGGAGGLELATALGKTLGRRKQASITLVDQARSHVWKPKLHEIAAGSMDVGLHEVSYRAQAHWHGFQFRVGAMTGIDRAQRLVHVAPFVDEDGVQVTPARSLGYDTLVIAVGSQSNDFGTPGVAEHALKLETTADARRFHRLLVNALIRANSKQEAQQEAQQQAQQEAEHQAQHHAQQPIQPGPQPQHQLHVAIIGAGATGVELAAELHRTTRELVAYGLDRIDPEHDLHLHLIEAAERVLPGLPERISTSAQHMLEGMGVQVHTSAKVAEVLPTGVRLGDGRSIHAELVVWAAGVKAADFLRHLDGLEANRINQLVVRPTLQTTLDDHVFAMGDCAACPWPEANQGKGGWVPPRAQAAHQQATLMAQQVRRRLAGQPLLPYKYRDFGSLVSLGELGTVGNMLGGLFGGGPAGSGGGSLMVEGFMARLMYQSLYKMHEVALHGVAKVALDTLARLITRRTEPHVKLH
jgi:NADH:ubiquinone reductase (H+-translocating)